MSSLIIYFFAVWFIPLLVISYGIFKNSKKIWITGIILIPVFLVIVPWIAVVFGSME